MQWLKDNVGIIIVFGILLIPVGFIAITAIKTIWALREEIISSITTLLAFIGAYYLYKTFKKPPTNEN